jgi:hypothetical protein
LGEVRGAERPRSHLRRAGSSSVQRINCQQAATARGRNSALHAGALAKWQAFASGCQLDNEGQAVARAWCQTYDNDRADGAPVSEHYFGVPPTQTLLILLTIPEEELYPDDDDD